MQIAHSDIVIRKDQFKLSSISYLVNRLTMKNGVFYDVTPCGSWIFTRGTQRNIPKDSFLRSQRRENLKSYVAITGWTL
jgi:hypothetical protein